jgi:hypothetical protein
MSYVRHRTELECETKCETCFTLIRHQNIGGGLPTLECWNGTCDMTGRTEFCDRDRRVEEPTIMKGGLSLKMKRDMKH